ncbi:MAG: hypothetical protein MUC68_15090, partial [Burkholderiaceae bacterium]|nr:hypothetical protein [Burkholderiaceae bacterium]
RLELDAGVGTAQRPPAAVPASALEPGALRAAAAQLAWRCGRGLKLAADAHQAELRCLPGQHSWRAPQGGQGIGPPQAAASRLTRRFAAPSPEAPSNSATVRRRFRWSRDQHGKAR